MRQSRTSLAGLAIVALLLSACSSGGNSPAPLATSTSAGATATVLAAPPVPASFTVTRKSGSVPCPSSDPNSGDSCSQTDFAWQANSDPGTGFRIYSAGTGEDPNATCQTAQAGATVKLEPKPAARTAQVFDPMAVGGGEICYWITAVNSSGESAQVPAADQ